MVKKSIQNKITPKRSTIRAAQKKTSSNSNNKPKMPKIASRQANVTQKNNYLGKIGGLVGMGAGTYMGGPLGGMYGAEFGNNVGSLLGDIFGLGKYKIKKNSLMRNQRGNPPMFKANRDGSVLVSKRELLGDVSGTVGFTNTSYNINPGDSKTFPWLSQLAQNFEEYECRGLAFAYDTTSGNSVGSTTTSLGSILQATEYNSHNPSFTSEQQMLDYEFACSVVPSKSQLHFVECAPKQNFGKTLFIRTGTETLPAGVDLNTYDQGIYQIATIGMQAACTVGKLWVTYEYLLKKPRLNPYLSNITTYDHVSSGGNATGTYRLGTNGGQGMSNDSTDNLLLSTYNGNVINIPIAGTFLLSANWVGTAIGAAPSATYGSNISSSNTATGAGKIVAYDSTAATYTDVITCVGSGVLAANQITFAGLTSMTAGYLDLFLIPIPATDT